MKMNPLEMSSVQSVAFEINELKIFNAFKCLQLEIVNLKKEGIKNGVRNRQLQEKINQQLKMSRAENVSSVLWFDR